MWLARVDAMLGHRIKIGALAGKAAEHRKPVRDVLDANLLGPRIEREKLLSRVRAQIALR
jgi:hypothetical protein